MADFDFSLDGLDAMIIALDATLDQIDQRVDEVLTKLAMQIISDARKLAPNLSGDLESALIVGEVKQLIGVSYIDFGTSPEVNDYAVVQHEGFHKTKKGVVVQMTPGEKTTSKRST